MGPGSQWEVIFREIDREYKHRFVEKTNILLQNKTNIKYSFLGASLSFYNERAIWSQDFPIIDWSKEESHTNPLINPKIGIGSGDHAYQLFREYFRKVSFLGKGDVRSGIRDLEKYCND